MSELLFHKIRRGNFLPPAGYLDRIGPIEALEKYYWIVSAMTHATIFHIQNVADYYYVGTDKEHWDLTKDFPCLVAPYDLIWMEYKLPNEINSEEFGRNSIDPDMRFTVGCLIMVRPSSRPHSTWELSTHVLLQQPGSQPCGPEIIEFLYLDEQGAYVEAEPFGRYVCRGDLNYETRELMEAAVQQVGMLIRPAYLAISLLHCRNVDPVLMPEMRSPKERRRAQRNGEPETAIHTIHITPTQPHPRQIKAQYGSDSVRRRMHMVRGHFAEYGPEFGKGKLFGRVSGRFWMSPAVKGQASDGLINQEYIVDAPHTPRKEPHAKHHTGT